MRRNQAAAGAAATQRKDGRGGLQHPRRLEKGEGTTPIFAEHPIIVAESTVNHSPSQPSSRPPFRPSPRTTSGHAYGAPCWLAARRERIDGETSRTRWGREKEPKEEKYREKKL